MDVSILLAMLSARLHIPMGQDFVTTGTISTEAGIILPVQGLPAKLAAAADHPQITRCVIPTLDADRSMAKLAPRARKEIAGAIAGVKNKLDVVAVHDVEDLVRLVLTNLELLLGALRSGYMEKAVPEEPSDDAVDSTARFLITNLEDRFWSALEELLMGQHVAVAKKLLDKWTHHFVDHRRYPSGFGAKMSRLLASLPATLRRRRSFYRLLTVDRCAALSRYAREADLDDVEPLFQAAAGRAIVLPGPQLAPLPSKESTSHVPEAVIRAISTEVLTSTIGIPVDTARATYPQYQIVVDSNEEFHDTVTSFFRHLTRHIGITGVPRAGEWDECEAIALVTRAFANDGGVDAAKAEARWATHGGMSRVLDEMTKQFKREQQSAYVNRILEEAISPLDWEGRVAFVRVLLERLILS